MTSGVQLMTLKINKLLLPFWGPSNQARTAIQIPGCPLPSADALGWHLQQFVGWSQKVKDVSAIYELYFLTPSDEHITHENGRCFQATTVVNLTFGITWHSCLATNIFSAQNPFDIADVKAIMSQLVGHCDTVWNFEGTVKIFFFK